MTDNFREMAPILVSSPHIAGLADLYITIRLPMETWAPKLQVKLSSIGLTSQSTNIQSPIHL